MRLLLRKPLIFRNEQEFKPADFFIEGRRRAFDKY
jgi:hypothetical protein